MGKLEFPLSSSIKDLLQIPKPKGFKWMGQKKSALQERNLLVMETNIDDMNPEFYNYISGKLFALGALYVSLVTVRMKKNRPGVFLRAL